MENALGSGDRGYRYSQFLRATIHYSYKFNVPFLLWNAAQVYDEGEKVPNIIERGLDKIFLGASHYKVIAQANGELYLSCKLVHLFDL